MKLSEKIAATEKRIATLTAKLNDAKNQLALLKAKIPAESTGRSDKNGRVIYTGFRVKYVHDTCVNREIKIGKVYRSADPDAGSLAEFFICFDDDSQSWLGLIPNAELEIDE